MIADLAAARERREVIRNAIVNAARTSLDPEIRALLKAYDAATQEFAAAVSTYKEEK